MNQGAPLTGQSIALVLFRWGTPNLALQARQVLALASASVADAGLSSIGDLLGLPDAGPTKAPGALRLLQVAGPTGTLCIRVQGPVIQVRLPAAAIHPLPLLLAARLRLPWVRALAFRAGEVVGRLGPKETGGRGFSRATSSLSDPGPAKASTSSVIGISDGWNDAQGRLILILDPGRGTIET